MRLNDEIKELISNWRPTLSNYDDIRIKKLIEKTYRVNQKDTLIREKKELINLLIKRNKEYENERNNP